VGSKGKRDAGGSRRKGPRHSELNKGGANGHSLRERHCSGARRRGRGSRSKFAKKSEDSAGVLEEEVPLLLLTRRNTAARLGSRGVGKTLVIVGDEKRGRLRTAPGKLLLQRRNDASSKLWEERTKIIGRSEKKSVGS